MEIVGIGTDIVECLRIGRMIEQHGELFLLRVFTEREIRYCQARQRATEHFAALGGQRGDAERAGPALAARASLDRHGGAHGSRETGPK